MKALLDSRTLDSISPINEEEKRSEEQAIRKAQKYTPTAWDKYSESARTFERIFESLRNDALTIADRLTVEAIKL